MARPRMRSAHLVGEAPSERTVADSESETHGVGLPPHIYANVDQFETLQTQMTLMMTLLHNQIHVSADDVTSPLVNPAEHTHVQPSQGDLAAPVVDRRVPHPPVQDLVNRPPPHQIFQL
ncbi:hypothetical protein Adt_18499 [Abeliophyllum distichum]|uniref:Uncharacterized protein n=1 Tax=Abeliophyllum distichum TaxID=126358 RepID=A0ABD1TJK0_9LAMI